MAEFLLTFVILLLIVAAMAIGVIRGRAPISGSCGGLNNIGVGGACEICGGDTNRCEENSVTGNPPAQTSGADPLFHEANDPKRQS